MLSWVCSYTHLSLICIWVHLKVFIFSIVFFVVVKLFVFLFHSSWQPFLYIEENEKVTFKASNILTIWVIATCLHSVFFSLFAPQLIFTAGLTILLKFPFQIMIFSKYFIFYTFYCHVIFIMVSFLPFFKLILKSVIINLDKQKKVEKNVKTSFKVILWEMNSEQKLFCNKGCCQYLIKSTGHKKNFLYLLLLTSTNGK